MPTISDAYNELVAISGKLDQLNGAINAETNATNAVNATLVAGFTNISQGMQVLANLEAYANKQLVHLTHQADTVICMLDQISHNTCELLNYAAQEVRHLGSIADDEKAIRDVIETVYPTAALDRARRLQLLEKIEACCPPEPEPPACTFEPCDRPELMDDPMPGATVTPFRGGRRDQLGRTRRITGR